MHAAGVEQGKPGSGRRRLRKRAKAYRVVRQWLDVRDLGRVLAYARRGN